MVIPSDSTIPVDPAMLVSLIGMAMHMGFKSPGKCLSYFFCFKNLSDGIPEHRAYGKIFTARINIVYDKP